MESQKIEALTSRVERLERALRRWRAAGAAAAAVLLGIAVFVAAPAGKDAQAASSPEVIVDLRTIERLSGEPVEVIRARKFVMVDHAGKPRGSLHVTATGSPALELYGKGGTTHVSLAVRADSKPKMVFHDRLGRVLWRAP